MADLPYQANRNAIWRYVFFCRYLYIYISLLAFNVYHSSLLLYQEFLESLHKKHTKNTKIIGGGGQYSPLRVMTH